MKEKNIKIAYDIMLSDGYTNLGTLEEFTKRLDKQGNREVVFNALLQAGVTNMGDFNNFEYNILGVEMPVNSNFIGQTDPNDIEVDFNGNPVEKKPKTREEKEARFFNPTRPYSLGYTPNPEHPNTIPLEEEGEEITSGIGRMEEKGVAYGATNPLRFQESIDNTGRALEATSKELRSLEQQVKQVTTPMSQLTSQEQAASAQRMFDKSAEYKRVVEEGSPTIFNNIAEGNIGDLEFAYLNRQREKELQRLKTAYNAIREYSNSQPKDAILLDDGKYSGSIVMTPLGQRLASLEREIYDEIIFFENIVTKEDWERNGHEAGFGKGLKNTSVHDILTLGIADAFGKSAVADVVKKHSQGEQLEPYEMAVVDALNAKGELQAITQGLGGATKGYSAGTSVAKSIPQMEQFALFGGAFGGATAGAGIGKNALNIAGKTLAMTAINPQTTISKYNQGFIDEFTTYGKVQDRSVWDRFTDAYGATAVEYLTEIMGGFLTSKIRPKGWLKTKLHLTDDNAVKQFLKRMDFHGPIEEFEEELWSNLLTPIAQGKSWEEMKTSWGDSFSKENLLTTALATAAMSGPMVIASAGAGTVQATHWRNQAKRAYKDIANTSFRQQIDNALKLNNNEDTMKALASIDWRSQDSSDIQNAWEYIQYKTYTYMAEGAEVSEAAKKDVQAKVALFEGMGQDGNVYTAEYEGEPVYIHSQDAAGASIIMRMDGTQEQVATEALKNIQPTPLSEVMATIYQQEEANVQAATEEMANANDKADAEELGETYRSPEEAQREFDRREGRKAPGSGFLLGDIVAVGDKEGEIISIDPYTRTARVDIDGESVRVPFNQMTLVSQESETAEQEQTPVAEQQTAEQEQQTATPATIQPITNKAGEIDVVAMGEEQTAQYVAESGDTSYVDDVLADRRKKLEKAQKGGKLPLNITERNNAIAARKAEIARLEQEIAMWEGVQNRLTAPQVEATPTAEQQAEQAVERTNVGYKLSDEVDENGRQFVETSSGSIEFGLVERESGLTPAPILLSEGMITNPQTNDGYGLVHIEARHGDQIRKAGYKSVVDFIEAVAKGYTTIREGKKRDGQQTYLLQLTDKHNNTLMVELSSDGTYWNINTAGIFKMSYGKNGKVVYNRYTTAKQTAESVEVSQESEQSGSTETPSISTPASPSENKNTTSVPENQTIGQENVSTATTNPHTREQVEGMAWEAGVVRNNESKRYRFTDVVDKIAKSLGVRIAFVDEVEEGGLSANGLYTSRDGKKTIYIATNRTRGVQFVVGHEILHHLKTISPEAYEQFVKAVMKEMGEEGFAANLNNLRKTYQRAISYAAMRGENPPAMPSDEVLAEEVVADYVGSLISATDGFTKFVKKHKGSKFMQALRSAIQHIRSFFKGANAWERAMDRRLKDLDTLLEDAVGEAKQSNVVKPAQKQTSITTPNNLIDGESGKAMLSLRTYNESGRVDLQKFLSERVKSGDLTQVDATDIITQMDEIYNICKEFTGKYGPFGQWSEASVVKDEDDNPVFSVIKTNGEYAMNLDFSLVCKKRRTLDAVLNEMIARGMIETATDDPVFIAQVNDVIRKYGFETACRLCFVDAKRFRVARVAQQFADLYNSVVRSMLPKGSKIPINSFDYAQRGVEQSENALNTLPDSELKIDALKKMSEGRSVKAKIAKHLLDNPQDRKLVSVSDFVSTKGFDAVATENPALLGLYNSKKGSGDPKAAFSDVQYLGDVAKANWDVEKAYAVGGVRIQSFSDFVPRMIFDYIQMVGDLAAKNLPAHAYTKEPIFAKIFGKTGIKINLSLVPAVVENGVAAGLDAEGSYTWQEGETFPYEEAIALQNAEGYRENVGTIAVGVSDEHILKMLGDDNIRMVIPYHKSGLNPAVAKANNIDGFKDYTSEQNTRYGNGNKLSKEDAAQAPDFNQLLRELGSAKAAADAYLAWCAENGYKPKFDKFASHPNYYKLLEDFTTTVDGVNVPQEGVRMQFPEDGDAFGSLEELIEQGLEEDAVLEGMRDEKVSQIVDELDGVRFSLREDTESLLSIKEMDAPYLEAVERGDMETAQRMVDEAARLAGYSTDESWRMQHRAPVRDEENSNPFNTEKIVPEDYWEHPEWYSDIRHNSSTRESFYNMLSAIRKYKQLVAEGKQEEADKVTVKMYRGVDKTANKREGSFRNGDWITPSRSYAVESAPYGKARVIEQEVPLKNIWWDGNSMNEWGYDDGSNYTYRDTKNNRKLLDPVTYDDNGNVIPLSERFNPRREDVRFSIMGERGAANLDAAEEVTTRLDNLNVAREMESAGKDAKTIKLATGWERGADGKWRYEIDDLKLVNPEEWVNKKGRLTLKDIVANAEELFAAYPELRDIKIKKSAAVNNNGAYNHAENTITLSVGVLRRGLEIQSNIERFDTTRENIDKLMDKVINVEVRGTILHEIQHAIQHIEGFARGGNSKMIDASLDRAKTLAVEQEMINQINEKVRQYNSMPVEERRTPSGVRLRVQIEEGKRRYAKFKKSIQLGDAGYRKLAGEVESRNVEKRLGMTPEERRNALLAETEDVAREDQIFILNGMEMAEKKKIAEETVSPKDSDHPAAISSATGAKILNNLDNLAKKYQEKTNRPDTFIGDVARALDIEMRNKPSKYGTYLTISGDLITLRLSNHGATVSEFDARNEEEAISIVIDNKYRGGANDGNAHIVEYFYDARKLRKAEGKPLVDIIKSIKQTLYSGQYVDNTGLATRIEINERFSLRLPEYQESFKALSEEYNALDKNDAEEMAEIQAEREAIEREAKANGTWLKAPNGKSTNLTPEQWVNVRTSRFKEWFGDWELANLYNRAVEAWNNKDSKGKVVFGLSDRAKARFAEILGKDIKQLVITDDSIRHIKNHHSQNEELRGQKDMLPEDVVVIPYLINNYDFMEPSPDHNDKMGNRAIEIRKRINGISIIATIEKGKDKEFLVTSYQFVKSDALDASTETPGLNVRNDSDIANVQKDIKNIKNAAINSSKVVDANGEPMVVYHGSNWKGITTFDRSQSKRRRSGLREYGHFFTTNRALAEMYSNVDDAPEVVEELARLDAQIETAAENKDIDKMLDLYTEKERITRNLGGRVYEVFLNMRDVAEFDADYQADRGWYNLKADVGYKTAIGRDAMEAYAGQNSMTGDRLRKDGIIGRNIIDLFVGTENKEELRPYYDKFGGDVFLVFDPQNIKSATDNAGTYSSENPDIRFSLRLPQYTDAFAALKEEYNALDKSDAEAVADFRARKREVVDTYWHHLADQLGADVEVMVLNSTNNPEALRPLYEAYKEGVEVEMLQNDMDFAEVEGYEEFSKTTFPDNAVAICMEYVDVIATDVAKIDEINTIGMNTALFIHEYVHHLVKHNIDKRTLYRIWKEVALTDFAKELRLEYPSESSVGLAHEYVAYYISGFDSRTIKPLFDFIEGVGEITIDDIVNRENNSLPLRDETVRKILNIIRNGYQEKGTETYEARGKENPGSEESGDTEEGRSARRGSGIAESSGNRGNGRAVDGTQGSVRPEGTIGREVEKEADTYDSGGTLQGEVAEDIPQFDESPRWSLRKTPSQQIKELIEESELVSRRANKLGEEDKKAQELTKPSEGLGRKIERSVFNYLRDVESMQEKLYAAGVEKTDDNDFINTIERVGNIIEVMTNKANERVINPMLKILNDISAKHGIDYDGISDYLAAKHAIEREDTSNIRATNPNADAVWSRSVCKGIVEEFESKVSKEELEALWNSIRAISKYTLDILQESGILNRVQIENILSHNWQYYVPLRDWDTNAEELNDPSVIYDIPNRGGSTKGSWTEHSAEGRTTKPFDPIATMATELYKAIHVSEYNKAMLVLNNLVSDAKKVLGSEITERIFKSSDVLYRKNEDGTFYEVDITEIDRKELERNNKLNSEISKLIRERKAARKKNDNKKVSELDEQIAEKNSELTIFTRANNMEIPKEVIPNDFVKKARRVYFTMNGRRMYVQFVNPKYSTAINQQTIFQRNALDRFVSGFTRFISQSHTTWNPDFALVTNPIRDFRDAVITHALDVENGNLGGFIHYYVFLWNGSRAAIHRGLRGTARPLTEKEMGDKNILNRDDRRALKSEYGGKRVRDTLFQMFRDNGGITGWSSMGTIYTNNAELKERMTTKRQGRRAMRITRRKNGFSTHKNVIKAVADSAEIITRFATFLASLDKGMSVGQSVANGRNVSVNFNRKGEISDKMGAHYSFFNASMQGIYKQLRLGRKHKGRFALVAGVKIAMGYGYACLFDMLMSAYFPDDDDDLLVIVEAPLWMKLGYTCYPKFRGDNTISFGRIPKPIGYAAFSNLGVLLREIETGRLSTEEALEEAGKEVVKNWGYGFSEGTYPLRGFVPEYLKPFADLIMNQDSFGREIHRTDKFDNQIPNSELGQRNVIPAIYEATRWLNKVSGGNEFKSGSIDINPSDVQYILQSLAGGYGVIARKTIELGVSIVDDQVEFEMQNIPLINRINYTVAPKSWYEDYAEYEQMYGAAAWRNARNEYKAGYIDMEELESIGKRHFILEGTKDFEGLNDAISKLLDLRSLYSPNTPEYEDINSEINRTRGMIVKVMEETDWDSFNYRQDVKRVIEKYNPDMIERLRNLYRDYGKKE